jgi:hypothetical protein
MMQTYFAQLEQLLVPLLIAAVIFIFSITVFFIWSRRIQEKHPPHDIPHPSRHPRRRAERTRL